MSRKIWSKDYPMVVSVSVSYKNNLLGKITSSTKPEEMQKVLMTIAKLVSDQCKVK